MDLTGSRMPSSKRRQLLDDSVDPILVNFCQHGSELVRWILGLKCCPRTRRPILRERTLISALDRLAELIFSRYTSRKKMRDRKQRQSELRRPHDQAKVRTEDVLDQRGSLNSPSSHSTSIALLY